MKKKLMYVFLCGFWLCLSGLALATEGVSPGAVDHVAQLNNPCPTFSWTSVEGASGYELVGYVLPEDPQAAPRFDEESEVLYRRLPAGSTSWTPAADQCLAPGGRYIWFVRSVSELAGDEVVEAGDWSEGRYFAVPSAPSAEEMKRALEVLRRWDAAKGEGSLPLTAAAVPAAATVPATASGSTGHRKSVPTASAAIRGENPETDSEAYGVVGVSASVYGAGVGAANTEGGPDLLLDGTLDGGTNTSVYEWGIDRSSASDETFWVRNTGGGAMTLDVNGTLRGTGLDCPDCVTSAGILDGDVGKADLADGSVTGAKIVNGAVDSAKIRAGAVENAQLADNAVTTGKILDGTIAAADLADNAVTGRKIQDGAVRTADLGPKVVTTDKIADNAVTGVKIANGSIATTDLDNGSVTGTKLADDAVATRHLKTGAVDSAAILDGTITAADLAPESVGSSAIEDGGIATADIDAGAVGTGQLADGAVTADKLAPGAIGAGSLADDSVTSTTISNGTIAAVDLADGAVTGSKLADGSVQNAKLGPGAVITDKLHDAAVTNAKMAMNSVTSSKILDGSIVGADLADGAVSGSKLGLNSVTGAHIVDGAVGGTELADNAVFSTKVLDGSLSGADISDGSLSGVDIADGSIHPVDVGSGFLTSKSDVYAVSEVVDLSDWGEWMTLSARCNDENDIPIAGTCNAWEHSIDLYIEPPVYVSWDNPLYRSEVTCLFLNVTLEHINGSATIYCVDIP